LSSAFARVLLAYGKPHFLLTRVTRAKQWVRYVLWAWDALRYLSSIDSALLPGVHIEPACSLQWGCQLCFLSFTEWRYMGFRRCEEG
jgi:hypothetical protein